MTTELSCLSFQMNFMPIISLKLPYSNELDLWKKGLKIKLKKKNEA